MKTVAALLLVIGGFVFVTTLGARSETVFQQLCHQQTAHTGLLLAILGACLAQVKEEK